MRILLFVILCNISGAWAGASGVLFDPNANGQDFVSVCSSIYVDTSEDKIDRKSLKAVDAAWATLNAKTQCYSFLTGILHGAAMQNLKINKILNRAPTDTTISAACIPDIDQDALAKSVYTYAADHYTIPQRISMSAGFLAYSTLAILYPCKLEDPI